MYTTLDSQMISGIKMRYNYHFVHHLFLESGKNDSGYKWEGMMSSMREDRCSPLTLLLYEPKTCLLHWKQNKTTHSV